MNSLQFLIVFPSLVFSLEILEDSYSYRLSHGFYLKPLEEQPHIYTETTPLLFSHNFNFIKPTDYQNTLFHVSCNKTKLRPNDTDYGCLIEPEIFQILGYLDSRLNQLKIALTGNGYLVNYPVAFDHDLSNVPEYKLRSGRQLLMAAAAAGSYVGYKVYDYFHSSTDTDAIYKELTTGMDHIQTGLIQQSHAITDLSHYTDQKINNIISKFNSMISVAEVNTRNEDVHFKSLYSGEMRQFLLLANLARDLAQQADLLVYQAALSDCKNHKLPISIINLGLLKHQLSILSPKLGQRGFEFVFPIDNLSPYYHHSLTTCNINSFNNSVSITLRIPIKRKVDNYKLVSGVSIPFFMNNMVCQYSVKYFQVIYKNDMPTVIDNDKALVCTPDHDLCYYREYINTHNIDKNYLCIKRLLLGTSLVDLKNLCTFTCRNISADEIFITQLTPSYYAVTNLPRTASLRCHSSQIYTSINLMNDSKIIQSTHPPGSFLIHLHCFCTAIISPSIQLYPDVLCKDEEQLSIIPPVHVLIPSRWSTISHPVIAISTLETQLQSPTYQNLSSLLLSKSIHADLDINYTTHTFPTIQELTGHLLAYHSSYLLYLELFWNIFLTLMLYLLWAKHYNMSTRLYGLPFLSSLLPKIRPVNALTEEEIVHKLYVLFITIGVLDLMFVSCCILLLYFHLKRKWTRQGPGCEFYGHNGNDDKDHPYFVRHFDATAPLTEAHIPMQNVSHPHATHLPKNVYPTLKRHADK